MVSEGFRKQLEGYGLTTAEILYRLPDHPAVLQTYVWQDYDLCPKFPVLNKFLAFWLEKIEGPLHSVTVAHARLIKPAEIRAINGEFRLHSAALATSLLVKRRRLRRRTLQTKLVPAGGGALVDALPQQRRLRELCDVFVRLAGVDQHL